MILIYLAFNLLGLFYYLYYQDSVLFILLALFNLYIFYKEKVKVLLVLLGLILGIFYYNHRLKEIYPTSDTYQIVKVNTYDYIAQNNQTSIILKTDRVLNLYDKVKVSGVYEKVYAIENQGLFSYTNHLKSKGIFYQMKTQSITVLETSNYQKEDKDNKTQHYFDYIFLQDKSNIDGSIISALVSIGIIHAFVVSGMHFNLLENVLGKSLFFIQSQRLHKLIVYSLLFTYLAMINYTLPALRAFMMIVLKDRLSSLQVLSLFVLGILLYNPYIVLGTSFTLTLGSTLIILYLSKYPFKHEIISSMVISLMMLPMTSNINYVISLFCFIFNILFAKICMLFFTMIILGQFIGLFNPLSNLVLSYFEEGLLLIDKYNIMINTGYFNLVSVIIYYLLLHCLIKYRKVNIKLLFVLYMVYLVYLPRPYTSVTFLNVGQADTAIIVPAYTKKAILIDVGLAKNANTIQNITYPFLKSRRIRQISHVFISHDDSDHVGGLEELKSLVDIENVVKKKEQMIKIGNLEFIDINYDETFKDVNANSMTLYTVINGVKFLFTGDMDKESEQAFVSKLDEMKVDVLKVAHHGSKTSSSQLFLDLIQAKMAFISSGYKNTYGHPHQEVVQRLNNNNIQVIQSSCQGNLSFYLSPIFSFYQVYQNKDDLCS